MGSSVNWLEQKLLYRSDEVPSAHQYASVAGAYGVAVIGEAVRHLVKERQALFDPAQQQEVCIGSDGTADSSYFPLGLSVVKGSPMTPI